MTGDTTMYLHGDGMATCEICQDVEHLRECVSCEREVCGTCSTGHWCGVKCVICGPITNNENDDENPRRTER